MAGGVHRVMCVEISCDGCGTGPDTHFVTVADAVGAVLGLGWVHSPARLLCPACIARWICTVHGHTWDSWTDIVCDLWVGRSRPCLVCDHSDYDPPLPWNRNRGQS